MELNHLEKHKRRLLLIFTLVVEVYLIFTNVSYVILKKRYFVPLLLKDDQKLRRYRVVSYFSRTLYLVCSAIYSSVELGRSLENNIDTSFEQKAVGIYLVPVTYLFMSVLCRIVFAWIRSVLIKYSINMSYTWDSVLFGFNSCYILAIFTWYLTEFYRHGEHHCLIDDNIVIICAVIYVTYELLSFLLFYMPLRKVDRLFDRSPDGYGKAFLTTNQQLDDMESGQDEMEKDHHAVLLESQMDESITASPQISQNCLGLVKQFHISVKRNLRAGVLTIITGSFQCAIYFIYLGSAIRVDVVIFGKKTGFEDMFVRLIIIILGLLQYMCMMLTESNWQRAFIPFWCWQKRSWTF